MNGPIRQLVPRGERPSCSPASLRRRFGHLCAIAASSAALLVAPGAEGQELPSLALNRFSPAPAGDRFFGLSDANVAQHLHFDAALVLDYAHNPLVVESTDASGGRVVDAIVSDQLHAHIGAALSLWQLLKVDIAIPVALYQDGSDPSVAGSSYTSPTGAAFGDIRLGARIQIFREKSGAFVLGGGGSVWLPTGASGQGAFMSDGSVRGEAQLMASGKLGAFVYGFTTAADLRRGQDYAGTTQGSRFLLNGAAGFVFGPGESFQLGPEANVALTFDRIARETTNSEVLLGGKWRATSDFVLGAAGGMGLAGGAGTPDWRALLSLAYSPLDVKDSDGDGVMDPKDACPAVRGVASEDPGKNGCPDDADGDGIRDRVDSCPAEPGPANKDPKLNGCPDADGDGIVDKLDACPKVAGAADADPKKNGCPADADGDGVWDQDDACPSVPGVRTSEPKTNGCPPDKDRDGVEDDKDACPAEPGPATSDAATNGCPDEDHDGIVTETDACPKEHGRRSDDPAKNGCPIVQVAADKIVILQKVLFATGSAVIDPASYPLLDDIAQVLREHEEIRRVEVQGHTDDRGSRWLNTKLSKDRAESVRMALIERGTAPERLTAKGFGPTVPLGTNKTEEGREKNRRVELKILESHGSIRQGEAQ